MKGKQEFNFADQFVLILILVGTILIFIPETVYFKDIFVTYPRANTMWKVAYQIFILLSLASGYIVVRILLKIRSLFKGGIIRKTLLLFYLVFSLILFFLVSIYPNFSINSYYNGLKNYYGLNGTNYLKTLYPEDSKAIAWINQNIKGQPNMLEAQGDSYTDYERISVNTGLPTAIGWTVHEWFWRNNYPIVASRINDVSTIYETHNISLTKQLLKKYDISYVYVGYLERQKYPDLYENKFQRIGNVVFEAGQTKIFKLSF